MEVMQFIKKVEDYYGKYRPGMKREIIAYLRAGSNKLLPDVYKYLLLHVSSQYNFVPDIAAIETGLRFMRENSMEVGAFTTALPDPEARDYSEEIGQVFRKLIGKKT